MKPLKDEDIVSLYKESASETPSRELDEKILAYAKAQTKKKRNWWPYIGLAASVGFVVILAPWEWADQTMPVAPEPKVRSDKRMKVQPQTQQAPVMMKAMPEADLSEGLQESELALEAQSKSENKLEIDEKLFKEVEVLLAKGEEEKARETLRQMLENNPELKKELPEHLKILLAE